MCIYALNFFPICDIKKRRKMPMRMTEYCMMMIMIFTGIDRVFSIHFRGGTFNWAPVSNIPATTINVSIVQSYSWVRTYEYCDSSTIATQGIIGDNITLQCGKFSILSKQNLELFCIVVSGCATSGGYCNCINTAVICTDYSITQDLSSGQKIDFLSIGQNAMFYISFQDGNWLPLATAAAATWSITSYVNLSPRSNNGLLNTPPVVSVLPVIQLPVSVQSVINLLVVDIDNDYVQCRWGHVGSVDECKYTIENFPFFLSIVDLGGGVCQSVTGSLLLSNCSLIFTPTVPQVYYAAAIMVEDFYSSSNTITPLSSTPVQFLIHTYNSPISCSTLPTIIGPYPDRSCIDVKVGISFSFTVTAQIGCTGTTITDFVSVSPLGMSKATSILTVSSTVYSINFNWTPTSIQIGSHVFCVAAVDTYNSQSNQVCYKFMVGLVASINSCPPTTTTITTVAITNSNTTTPTNSGIKSKILVFYSSLIE